MTTQTVLDYRGDTKHVFDPANAAEVEAAMARFRALTGGGHIVAENKLDADGKPIQRLGPARPDPSG
jgi:hypothetical protein